jgi:hypothetical protein
MSDFLVLLLVVIVVWVAAYAVVGLVVVVQPSAEPIKRYPLIVLYAALLHYVWAAALLTDARAGEITSMSGLYRIFGASNLAIVLFVVATLALAYVFFFAERGMLATTFAVPQQAVLLLSAWSAVDAMASGRFPDGVERPIAFIVADQSPAVIAATLHAAAIFIGLWRRNRPLQVTVT